MIVDPVAFNLAKQSTAVNGFIGTLLMNPFDLQLLLISNYKGGKSTMSSTENCHPGLDPGILEAIQSKIIKKKFLL